MHYYTKPEQSIAKTLFAWSLVFWILLLALHVFNMYAEHLRVRYSAQNNILLKRIEELEKENKRLEKEYVYTHSLRWVTTHPMYKKFAKIENIVYIYPLKEWTTYTKMR
jgi:hypothetical protein